MNMSGNKQHGKRHNTDDIPVSQKKFKSSLLEVVMSDIDKWVPKMYPILIHNSRITKMLINCL
jgi:hypothetical protein